MALNLSDIFKNDTSSKDTNLIPLVNIGSTDGSLDSGLNISTQSLNFDGKYFSPILLNIPAIRESIDVVSKKYKISSVHLDINNYEFDGLRFSDSDIVKNGIKNLDVRIFWKSPSATSIEDTLIVFKGKVVKYSLTEDKVKIILEDESQTLFHRDLPLPENYLSGDINSKDKGKPKPIVYGRVDRSPTVIDHTNKLILDSSSFSTLVYTEPSGIPGELGGSIFIGSENNYISIMETVEQDLGSLDDVAAVDNDGNVVNADQIETVADSLQWVTYPEFGYVELSNTLLLSNNIIQGKHFHKPSIKLSSIGSDYQNNLLTDSDQERLSDSNYEQSINFGSNIAEYEYPLYLGGNYEDRIDDTYFFTLDISVQPSTSDVKKYRTLGVYMNQIELPVPHHIVNNNGDQVTSHPSRLWIVPAFPGYDPETYFPSVHNTKIDLTTLNQLFGFPDEDSSLVSGAQWDYTYGNQPIDIKYWVESNGVTTSPSKQLPIIYIHDNCRLGDNAPDNGLYRMIFGGRLEFTAMQVAEGEYLKIRMAIGNFQDGYKGNFKEFDAYSLVDIESALNKDFYANVLGREKDNCSVPNIVTNLIQNELGRDDIDVRDTLSNASQGYDGFNTYNVFQHGFTINEKVNSKKIIEDLCSVSPYMFRFNSSGDFKGTILRQSYEFFDVQVDQDNGSEKHIVKYDDTISISYSRTEEVYTKVVFKYKWDYHSKEFLKEHVATVGDTFGESIQEKVFDYYKLKDDHSESTLVLDHDGCKTIRIDATADSISRLLLSWYANQHLKIKCKLPISYSNIEVSDIIRFDGKKINPYGINYTTQVSSLNGQNIYGKFIVNSTNKTLSHIEIEATMLHRIKTDYCGAEYDCNDECGGGAIFNDCGICGDGTCVDTDGDGICDCNDDCPSGIYDCNGVCDGSAVIDQCGVCGGSGYTYECSNGSYACDPSGCYSEGASDEEGVCADLTVQDMTLCKESNDLVEGWGFNLWYPWDSRCYAQTGVSSIEGAPDLALPEQGLENIGAGICHAYHHSIDGDGVNNLHIYEGDNYVIYDEVNDVLIEGGLLPRVTDVNIFPVLLDGKEITLGASQTSIYNDPIVVTFTDKGHLYWLKNDKRVQMPHEDPIFASVNYVDGVLLPPLSDDYDHYSCDPALPNYGWNKNGYYEEHPSPLYFNTEGQSAIKFTLVTKPNSLFVNQGDENCFTDYYGNRQGDCWAGLISFNPADAGMFTDSSISDTSYYSPIDNAENLNALYLGASHLGTIDVKRGGFEVVIQDAEYNRFAVRTCKVKMLNETWKHPRDMMYDTDKSADTFNNGSVDTKYATFDEILSDDTKNNYVSSGDFINISQDFIKIFPREESTYDYCTDKVTSVIDLEPLMSNSNYGSYFAQLRVGVGESASFPQPNSGIWKDYIDVQVILSLEVYDTKGILDNIYYTVQVPIRFEHKECDLPGDLTGDGNINVLDVVSMMNCVLADNCSECHDMNGDGVFNVMDIVYLSQIVFGSN